MIEFVKFQEFQHTVYRTIESFNEAFSEFQKKNYIYFKRSQQSTIADDLMKRKADVQDVRKKLKLFRIRKNFKFI